MNEKVQNLLIKNEINILIDNILKQEDELNKYINASNNKSTLNSITRNNQRIDNLSNLIKKETKIAEDKIKSLEEEIFQYQKQINEINEPKVKYKKKDLEQNLIKEKFLLKTIGIHQIEMNQLIENLKLLKEEKLMISNDLINLMSLRENFEDIIKTRAKYIFKIRKKTPLSNKSSKHYNKENTDEIVGDVINININLEENNNNNININDIKIEYHDILNITSINKLCNYIYKIIATNIVSNFSSLLIELNLKNIIFSCVENAFNKYIKNNQNLIITNKITNLSIREISVNIVNYNIKINNIFIQPQFELLLKCIFKLFSLEKKINEGLKFVNNDYVFNKNALKEKKFEIEKKINECIKQRKELNIEKNKINNDCNLSNEYLKKIDEIKNIINIKENEIKKIKEELNLSLSVYQGQMDELIQENKNLENKYNNNNFKYKIENINQQIDFLFQGIKSKLKEINDPNQKDLLIQDMIQDINNSLESNNYFNNNNNNFNKSHIIYNNLINIDDNNIKNEEENEDNDMLSSYNSLNLENQVPVNIYYKKIGKKIIKNKFDSDKGLNNKNQRHNVINVNNVNKETLDKYNQHYLKLSECFQFNN